LNVVRPDLITLPSVVLSSGINDGRTVDSCWVQTYELLWYSHYVGNCHQLSWNDPL